MAQATVDLTKNVQSTNAQRLGIGSSTFGARVDTSTAQNTAERNLDARYVRLPVGYRNGRVTGGASGGPNNFDMKALVDIYRSWGYRMFVSIAGRSNDINMEPGDAKIIMQSLGFDNIDYTGHNEPDGNGMSTQAVIDRTKQISDEGRSLNPSLTMLGPVWVAEKRGDTQNYISQMGNRIHGVDWHRYGQGNNGDSANPNNAFFMNLTPDFGRMIRDARTDLRNAGRLENVAIDEINWRWTYQNDSRFYKAENMVWIASVCGHALRAGGAPMIYATQNGPLGVMIESGNNDQGRPGSSPMPAYWGIGVWTGAKKYSHYKDAFFDTTSDDPNCECFAVSNEAGGYNVVIINKSDGDQSVTLKVSGVTGATYDRWVTNNGAPFDGPTKADSAKPLGTSVTLTQPRMSVSVFVISATGGGGGTTPPPDPTPDPTPIPTPTPTPPVGSVSTSNVTDSAVTVNWTPPTGTVVTGYIVGRDGTDSNGGGAWTGTVGADLRAFTFTLLKPSTLYTFSVAVTDAVGTGTAKTAKATTTGGTVPPPDPTPPPDPEPTPPPTTSVYDVTTELATIKAGTSRTKMVRTLQGLLRARGQNVSINGTFGSGLTASVKTFQSANGLGADGIVGPATWEKLING